MIGYVLKNNHRFAVEFYIYEDKNYRWGNLNEAKLFDDEITASNECKYIKDYCNVPDCKVVKVEIKEIEE